MTRFLGNDKRSEIVTDTQILLHKILDEHGIDFICRVNAEVLSDSIRKAFIDRYKGIKQVYGHSCIHRVINGGRTCPGRRISGKIVDCSPPCADHTSMWSFNRNAACYVSQPYCLSLDALQEMVAFAEKYDLFLDIGSNLSWHFPIYTICVVWWNKKLYNEITSI